MKKVLGILILSALVGCYSKAIPTIPTRTIDPPPPVAEPANTVVDSEAGLLVFNARCNRCHGIPDPIKYTAQRWEHILLIMIPRARLTIGQGNNVRAYLLAHSAQ